MAVKRGQPTAGPAEPQAYERLHQELEQRVAARTAELEASNRVLAALHRAGQVMAATLDLNTILASVATEVQTILDAEGTSIVLHRPPTDDEPAELVFAAVTGPAAHTLLGTRFPVTAGIAGTAFTEGRPVIVGNARVDGRFYDRIDATTGVETHSLLAVPMIAGGVGWGVLEAINKRTGDFTDRDVEILQALASSAAIAISNANLYDDVKEKHRRLQESQAQLIQAEKISALGRLTASIAHEINNPLQAVLSGLSFIRDELQTNENEDIQFALSIAMNEIQRIADILHRLRGFYRKDDERRPTNVNTVLDEVLHLARNQFENHNIVVEREGLAAGDGFAVVTANADRLKQVFLNLVLNAIDAMPDGGRLIARIEQGTMRSRSGGPDVPATCIEIGDTGDGIEPELLQRIFEPFFTTKSTGSGLGLAISSDIIHSFGGELTARSAAQVGTTFTVLLPVGGSPDTTQVEESLVVAGYGTVTDRNADLIGR